MKLTKRDLLNYLQLKHGFGMGKKERVIANVHWPDDPDGEKKLKFLYTAMAAFFGANPELTLQDDFARVRNAMVELLAPSEGLPDPEGFYVTVVKKLAAGALS